MQLREVLLDACVRQFGHRLDAELVERRAELAHGRIPSNIGCDGSRASRTPL
jgi:hypothetical protein